MQDVLEGYRVVNAFLRDECGLSKLETVEVERLPEPNMEDYEDIGEYLDAYTRYAHSLEASPVRILFDETKMTKSAESYLEEAGVMHLYDSERNIVYNHEFYRDAHLRYQEYLRTRQTSQSRPIEIGVQDFETVATNIAGIAEKENVGMALAEVANPEVQAGDTVQEQGE